MVSAHVSNGPGRDQVVVFHQLSASNLVVAAAFRLLGRRVVFIKPVGCLRATPWLDRLARAGIELADFHSYAGLSLSEDLRVTARYTRAVLDAAFTDSDFDALQAEIPAAPLTAARSRAVMFDLVFNRLLRLSEAYALAEYFQSHGIHADIFQRASGIDSLISPILPTTVRNLYPGVPIWFVRALDRFPTVILPIKRALQCAARMLRSRTDPISADPGSRASGPDTFGKEVLYFPHKGITYGGLFVKDQYYSEDSASPFHKSNIAHIELAWTMSAGEQKLVESEYRLHSIQPHFLELDGQRNASAWLEHLTRFLAKVSGKHRLAKAAILAIAALRFENYRAAMAPCRDARIAVFGYDVLIPSMAALALQSFGIHVAALQERFINPFYGTSALILNTYFVHGEAIVERINQDPYQAIDKVIVTGDPRRGRIAQHRKDAAAERRERFREFRAVCLVLDYHTNPDPLADPFHFWTDAPSNLLYFSHIADLAELNNDCAFVIRGKDSCWLKLAEMAPAKDRFAALDNVFIDDRYDVYDRSYALAAMADVVVARYTSLCDQCLAEGIPVLIHDPLPNGGRLISAWHDYAPHPILTLSFQELQQRFTDTLYHDRYLNPEQFTSMRLHNYGVGRQQQSGSGESSLHLALARIVSTLSCSATGPSGKPILHEPNA